MEKVHTLGEDDLRGRFVAQLREANEQLVLATLRAEALREEAQAARLAIEASEERFRVMVTTSAAVVFCADGAGRIRVDARAWSAFTGDAEIAGAPPDGEGWLAAVHPAELPSVRAAWARAVGTEIRYDGQHRLRRADGSYATVAVCAVRIPEVGPAREWIGTITDISERMELEEAREQFIAILGHDLRGPLGAISLGMVFLSRAGLPRATEEVTGAITRAAQRMDRMIGSLLDFARGRLGGGIPIVRVPFDLRALGAEAVSEAKQLDADRTITLTTSGDVAGEWDRDRIEQVLSNLLANAVQHGSDPIELELRGEGDDVVVTVQDHGPAISESILPSLFEPYRARSRSRGKGLGLGLYIVREIVCAHGGAVSVRSSTERGTTFRVVLPRRASLALA